MKIIKGPPNFSGPSAPSEPDPGESKQLSKSQTDAKSKVRGPEKSGVVSSTEAFENGLKEVAELARKQGIPKEATVAKVVDQVLEQVMGKEFLAKPEAASVREALTPLISSDEYLMGKLNSILSRLGNKS
jgi:hypothetical protein